MGVHTITVKSDGSITDQYGPMILKGTWQVVSNDVIKANLTSPVTSLGQVRYYRLDMKRKRFEWDYGPRKSKEERTPNP